MATVSRVDILRSMVEQDPRNSFARYGLAIEHMNGGDLDQAIIEFQTLLANDPDYVAGYFHAGRTLEKANRLEEAREIYEQGIQAATRKGDSHTKSEIQAALDMLGL